MSIESLRRDIDRLDTQLLHLLVERGRTVEAIGAAKARAGIAIVDLEREQSILIWVAAQAERPWDGEALVRVYAAILSECRRIAEGAGNVDNG